MANLIYQTLASAVGLWVAGLLLSQVSYEGQGNWSQVPTLLIIGLLVAVVNRLIKPVVKFLTFPFYLLTLGLLGFVVNAALLRLVEVLAGWLDVRFSTGPFWFSTIATALVLTVITWLLDRFVTVDGD
jgi:putative membrane protein